MSAASPSRIIAAAVGIPLAVAGLWFGPSATVASIAHRNEFMPHGYCYLWDPAILWLNVTSDALITLSYYCIPVVLVYFISKARDLPFNRIFWMFGAFILACGTTHLMEIWNIWHASYLLAGLIKAVTAAVSVLTAVMLIPLVPLVISLPGRVHLEEENRKLEQEIAARKRFDAPLVHALRRRVTLGFIVAVLLTVFIGFSTWNGARQAEQDAYWISHTHEVMETIQRTSRHVIEAETSARAFSLTGDEALLTHYQTARETILQDEDALRHITVDNLSQQKRIDVLQSQVWTALEFADSIIARRKLGPYPANEDALEIEKLLEVVRGSTRDMYDAETQLLGERTPRIRTGQRLSRVIAAAGVFLGVLLWVLARFAVNRQIDISARAQAEINTLNAELEQRVEERTAALRSEIAERERAQGDREQVLRDLADQKFALDQHAIVATTDVMGTITYVNKKFCTISQYSKDELIGQNHRILNSGHHSREFFQEMYRSIANGHVWRGDICNRAKDGSLYWVDTTIVPLLDSKGKPRQYMAIRADITERKHAEEMRERLAAVVDSSEDAIITKSLDGTINAWNRGAEKIFGYSASEVVGKPMLILFPADRVREEPDILDRIRRGESVEHHETVRIRKDGAKIDVSVTISPIRNEKGEVIGASTIARDITERKQAEEELRESEQRFQAMANGIPQLAWMAEADGHIFWYNEGWYQYTGTTFEQMEGWAWQSVHDPVVLPKVMEGWNAAIATGAPFQMEFPLRGVDGRYREFLTRVNPLKDAQGRVMRWFGTNTDISEHKEAQQRLESQAEELSCQAIELARSQEATEAQTRMLKLVLESIGEGLVAADPEGHFLIWNDSASKLLGQGRSDLPPDQWVAHYACYLPDEITPVPMDRLPLLRAIRGESVQTELFIRRPGAGPGVFLEFSCRPMKDDQGNPCGGVVAFRDITERRAAEREIKELNQGLEVRVAERTAQLQAANAELEAFTYSVSHDLRAPLRHISGFSKLLSEEFGATLPPEAQHHVQRIQDGTRRMGMLVDDLLNLARIGRRELVLQVSGMRSIVDELIQELTPESEGRKIEWKIGDLPFVECDPGLIKQVLQNLMANALKFTRPRTVAVIEIGQKDVEGVPALFVRDNGVGFSMKYSDKLFGVFQRLHRAEDFEGTGVGLATVQRIIKKHGGRIWAEAELGKGATFYFTIGSLETSEHKSRAVAGAKS